MGGHRRVGSADDGHPRPRTVDPAEEAPRHRTSERDDGAGRHVEGAVQVLAADVVVGAPRVGRQDEERPCRIGRRSAGRRRTPTASTGSERALRVSGRPRSSPSATRVPPPGGRRPASHSPRPRPRARTPGAGRSRSRVGPPRASRRRGPPRSRPRRRARWRGSPRRRPRRRTAASSRRGGPSVGGTPGTLSGSGPPRAPSQCPFASRRRLSEVCSNSTMASAIAARLCAPPAA